MRGERERNCLNRVRDNLMEASIYGLSQKDIDIIANGVFHAVPNCESSKFPDFIFEGGFIEHFQITSSHTSKKGALHQKEYAHYREKTDKEISEFQKEMNEHPSFDEVQERSWCFKQPEHSYENLVKSFESVWKNHIDSLKKYSGCSKDGIFLIEYPEFALAMCENIYGNVKEGLRYDDLREQQSFKAYRLSRDKRMLDFLYEYRELVKYIIYVYYGGCEIINLKHIPELKKLLPWDFAIYPLIVGNVETMYGISISNRNNEEPE